MKIITISIAAYNAERYIKEAIESIVKSKYLDKIEVIIVNDGSKDKTVEIVNDYVERYKNAVILINKENGGYGSTINNALRTASGKYFKLLDADDWFNTEELDKLIEYLSGTTTDIVFTDYFKFYEEESKYERVNPIKDEPNCVFSIEKLTDCNLNPAMFIRTEVLKDATFKITEKCFYTDLEFCARAVLLSQNYVYFPVSVYCYRIGRIGQSISLEGKTKHIDNHEYIIKLVADMIFNSAKGSTLYESVYIMMKGHITNYYLYLKPSFSNLRKFKNYCCYIDSKFPQTKKYLDKKNIKVFKNPDLLYLPMCCRNRVIYKLKKWIKL